MPRYEPGIQSNAGHRRELAIPEPAFLSTREAAAFLRSALMRTCGLAANGRLPVVTGFGRGIRVNRAALLDLVEANTIRNWPSSGRPDAAKRMSKDRVTA
jgi:hypothetical protein